MFVSAKMYCFLLISLIHLGRLNGMAIDTELVPSETSTSPIVTSRLQLCYAPGVEIEMSNFESFKLIRADELPSVAKLTADGRWCYVYRIVSGRPNMPTGETLDETRYCGPTSNTATEANPIGKQIKTDRCCQIHDQCPFKLNIGESFGDFTNDKHRKLSDCECDEEFRQCLTENRHPFSDMVGRFYFNHMRTSCIQLTDTISYTEMYNVTDGEEEQAQISMVQNELYTAVSR